MWPCQALGIESWLSWAHSPHPHGIIVQWGRRQWTNYAEVMSARKEEWIMLEGSVRSPDFGLVTLLGGISEWGAGARGQLGRERSMGEVRVLEKHRQRMVLSTNCCTSPCKTETAQTSTTQRAPGHWHLAPRYPPPRPQPPHPIRPSLRLDQYQYADNFHRQHYQVPWHFNERLI